MTVTPRAPLALTRDGRLLRNGGVIAYPTEAVWGLGCDPWNRDAVQRILALKQRPQHKGLILVAADTQQIQFLLEALPQQQREAARSHWPGPVTCLLPDPRRQIPAWVRGEHDTVAVRVTAHPLVRALCHAFGGPLVSTSCNPAGRPPARHPWQVAGYFAGQLDRVVHGRLGNQRQPSRILDIQNGVWLR